MNFVVPADKSHNGYTRKQTLEWRSSHRNTVKLNNRHPVSRDTRLYAIVVSKSDDKLVAGRLIQCVVCIDEAASGGASAGTTVDNFSSVA